MSQIQVDNIYNKEATGSPNFPLGANVTGVVTATSFSGSGANLTGIDATALKDSNGTVRVQANTTGAVITGNVSVGGTLTYEDVTNVDAVGLITARSGIKVTGGDVDVTSGDIDVTSGNIKVGTATTIDNSGVNVTGVITATSYRGDGSQLTGIEAAPTFQATASGSIANGKTIVLNGDATVSVAATTLVSNNVGTEVEIQTNSRTMNSVWISDTQVVVVWCATDHTAVSMAVGTVSGTTITYGTSVEVSPSSGLRGYSAGIFWDKSVNAGFVAIADGFNAEAKGFGFTVSGTTITMRAHASGGYWVDSGEKRCIRVASNGKGGFGMVYITSNGVLATRAGTINSSADISVGSNSNTWSGYNTAHTLSGASTCAIAYNPDLGTATSSSFGIFAIDNGNNGKGGIMSDVNDGQTTHTLNAFTSLVGIEPSPGIALTYNTEFNCFYSVYRVGLSNYSRTWSTQANGTTVKDIMSLQVDSSNASTDWYGVDYSPTTKKAYYALTTGSRIQAYEISFNASNSITVSALQSLTAANTDTNRAAMSANNTKGQVYVAVSDPSSPFYIKSHIWQTEVTTTNVTADNFLGFSAAAYTNGQTVTIKTVGNVDANQTGLTTASKYYVTTGGDLSLTADDPSVYAGLALNSTSIAVKLP